VEVYRIYAKGAGERSYRAVNMAKGRQVVALREATAYHDIGLARKALELLKRDNVKSFKFEIRKGTMENTRKVKEERFLGAHMTTVMERRAKKMGWEYQIHECFKITPQGVKVPRREIVVMVPEGENALPERRG